MIYTIELAEETAARLRADAQARGVAEIDLLREAVERIYAGGAAGTARFAALDALLRQRQERDGTALLPDVATQTLFAQWAEEDARMTDEEREAEDRLWQDFEKGINETRAALGMRRL